MGIRRKKLVQTLRLWSEISALLCSASEGEWGRDSSSYQCKYKDVLLAMSWIRYGVSQWIQWRYHKIGRLYLGAVQKMNEKVSVKNPWPGSGIGLNDTKNPWPFPLITLRFFEGIQNLALTLGCLRKHSCCPILSSKTLAGPNWDALCLCFFLIFNTAAKI